MSKASSKSDKKRLAPSRVAELIGKAAYHRLDECWMAKHPILALGKVLCRLEQAPIAV